MYFISGICDFLKIKTNLNNVINNKNLFETPWNWNEKLNWKKYKFHFSILIYHFLVLEQLDKIFGGNIWQKTWPETKNKQGQSDKNQNRQLRLKKLGSLVFLPGSVCIPYSAILRPFLSVFF